MMPTPPPGRVEQDVGAPPAELLGDLEAHRLLALDPVRLAQRRGVLPAVPLGDRRRHHPAGVADQPVHQVQLGTGDHALAPGDDRGVDRHRDQRAEPGPGGVRRPRGAGVAVGGHGDPGDAELGGPRHPDRRAAGLERAGRQQPVVLDQQPRDAEPGTGARRRQQRRHPLAERDHPCAGPAPAAARGSATGPADGTRSRRGSRPPRRRRGRSGPAAARPRARCPGPRRRRGAHPSASTPGG